MQTNSLSSSLASANSYSAGSITTAASTSSQTSRGAGGGASYQYAQATASSAQGGSSAYAQASTGAQTSAPPPQQSQWTSSGTKDGKTGSLNLGNGYNLNFNKKDSSVQLQNTKTGDTTRVWGDPHLDMNGKGGKSSTMFKGPVSFTLPDDTKIRIGTQPGKNPKVSYADNVSISRGGQQYSVNGLSQENSRPLTMQSGGGGASSSDAGLNLVAKQDGAGWINSRTGTDVTTADIKAA